MIAPLSDDDHTKLQPHAQCPDLIRKAIVGVLRNVQDGELPLFAWTLGLSQEVLLELAEQCH